MGFNYRVNLQLINYFLAFNYELTIVNEIKTRYSLLDKY